MLISHPEEKNVKAKPLVEHLLNVGKKAMEIVDEARLNLSIISKENLRKLAFLVGIFHDFGKATTFFQEYINNSEQRGDRCTRHSFLSAAVCYYFVKDELQSELWAYTAFMVIKRHHGDLEAFDRSGDVHIKPAVSLTIKQLENILKHSYPELQAFYTNHVSTFDRIKEIDFHEISEALQNSDEIIDDTFDEDMEKRIELFFITNYLFSLLIDNDKQDAARLDSNYFAGNLEEPQNDVLSYIDQLRKDNPEKFSPDITINNLRNRFLDEITTNDNISPDTHFYTIAAPTGIGKTFGCLAFANKLIEKLPGQKARIIYCLPYTSIIDQNFAEFEKIIMFNKGKDYESRPSRYLLKHHYLTHKKIKKRVNEEDYTYKDYLDDSLLVESWESAMIVTTFVQFFHTIIGYKNRFLKKFHNIVNSIVILDEVQNIDPHYYRLLKKVFHILGSRFNIYFLLVTATQPGIFDVEQDQPVNLVNSSFYMKHPVFNRIKLTIEPKPQPLFSFAEIFCSEFNGENCLLVMNTKSSAVELFKYIKKNKPGYKVYSLTTYLVPCDRRCRIEEIKKLLRNKKKIIVVSTQLIEAGVDISFKYVYRDFGPIDSIVQVAGRCNRNGEYGEGGGYMKLVRLINENDHDRHYYSYIYNPFITQKIEQIINRKEYLSKDFEKLSDNYFKALDFKKESLKLLNGIGNLNYDTEFDDETPVKNFKLIKEYESETIYILTDPTAQKKMDRLTACLDNIYSRELGEAEIDQNRLEIELLKVKMKAFQIQLREDELKYYRDSPIIEEKWSLRFIKYEDQKKSVYDPDIGFLKEPKHEVSKVFHD